jgi:hypothetical protein
MGGPDAKIDIATSVAGITKVVAGYRAGDPPYQDYTGQALSW